MAKLADFGVSDIQTGGQHKDYVKATAGTPAFFAPEMCGDDKTGSKLYSGRAADLWALGVCLHMWIFLRLPFEAPTVYMLMQACLGLGFGLGLGLPTRHREGASVRCILPSP